MALAMSKSSFHFIVLLFYATLLIPKISHGSQSGSKLKTQKHVAIFVFGDSIFDPGNNNFLNISVDFKANFPPYGESFFRYPTGRFNDGRLIPDYAALHANLPYWKPYLDPGYQNFANGANFASASGTVLPESNPLTLNFGIQVRYFKKVANLLNQTLGHVDAKKILRNAIYLCGIGGVDYVAFVSSYENGTESQQIEFVNKVIGNFTILIEEIYQMGGRKFALPNVGPLGCLPSAKQSYNLTGYDCYGLIQALATMHNTALSKMTKELESKLPGFKYLIYDFFNTLNHRIQDPTKYGFKESNVGCCGTGSNRATGCGLTTTTYELCSDPNEYVFFDGVHPTERCCSQLAELLWNGTSNVTWPLNMKQLYELEISSEDDGGPFNDEKLMVSSLTSTPNVLSH